MRAGARIGIGIDAEKTVRALLVAFVVGVSFLPLARLALAAFAPSGRVDLARLAALFAKGRTVEALTNTAGIALSSAFLSGLLGTAAAALVALTDFRGKAAWVFAFILPLMIPPQVTALSWIQALSANGPAARLLGLSFAYADHPLYSPAGIVALLGIVNAPLVFLSVRASLRRLPAELTEAAQAAGAVPGRLFRDIVLPLARPGIVAGTTLAFISAAGNFGIQAMLGIPARIPTLMTLIYQRMNSVGPAALPDMAALAVALAFVAVLGLSLPRLIGAEKDVRVDGAARHLSWKLGVLRLPAELAAWFYAATTLFLPLSSLAAQSLLSAVGQAFVPANITLENYRAALVSQGMIRTAFATSLVLALVACAVLALVGFFLAYFIAWRKSPAVRLLQAGTELAYALPGIVIGVAAILFFLKPLPFLGISLYGSVWLILAAYLSHFLALALRPALSGIAQVDRALDEAAQVYGAGFLRRAKDIVAPSVAPSLAAGAILLFLSMVNEIQVSVLLVTSRARTIGPMIVFLEESSASPLAAAVSCLMVALILLFMAAASALSRKLPDGVLPWRT